MYVWCIISLLQKFTIASKRIVQWFRKCVILFSVYSVSHPWFSAIKLSAISMVLFIFCHSIRKILLYVGPMSDCLVIIPGMSLHLEWLDFYVYITQIFIGMAILDVTLTLDGITCRLKPGCIPSWTVVLFVNWNTVWILYWYTSHLSDKL